ncbi:MAG: PHP domain-containing protein [Victivallales bacterium]
MIRLDMQVHSYHSYDSFSSPEAIAEAARENGLDGFSITDHNVFRVDYARLRQKYPGLIMIPGMEIGTELGDILLYFITKEIRTRKAEEAIDLAHEQGGIAVLAHPYHRRHYDYPEVILKKLDGIETRNSHNIENSKSADELGRKCGKCVTGGSDAHFLFEIGNGFTLVDFDKSNTMDMQELKSAFLKSARPDCIMGPSWTFIASQMIKYAKRFTRP